jgi:hypothetical protein
VGARPIHRADDIHLENELELNFWS